MTLTREGLLARATQAEALAANVADPVVSKAYLELAVALREMADKDNLAVMSDKEIEHLAERMVNGAASKL
jgi:hypothetical protein